ncbi:MAG: hypothetical protein ACP5N9_02685 [Candidatus Bilamarchaeum sp.]
MLVSQPRNLLYACLAVGIVGGILALVGGGAFSIIGALLAWSGTIAGVLIWQYGYLFIPLVTQRTNVIMMSEEGYEIPPSQDVIVKASNGVFHASVFLGLKIFESATEKSTDENIVYTQFFERAISNLKYVTKISYLLYVEDVGEKRKTLETKRAEAQLRLARERDKPQPDPIRVDKYERDVAMWDAQLTRLIKGIKPMGVIAYAQTSAVGLSKDAAIALAKQQANELKTVLANALNVEVYQLTADQMLRCFEWDKFFPVKPQELEESVG